MYESEQCRGAGTVKTGFAGKKVTECNLMEEDEKKIESTENGFTFDIKPFEVKTFRVETAIEKSDKTQYRCFC
ncbi:MAG: glycosyl hydrolase-related protein [Clostridia bacterium]|nr:glycosyl hydrolase-related protein [Clostridia bacterium]